MTSFTLNGTRHTVTVDPEMPLLWILRDVLGQRGTKYGCGVGVCGICTVLIDGVPQHACMVPLRRLEGRSVLTIEGLARSGHPLLRTWVEEQVPQCGYCQPGQLLAAAALLALPADPGDAEIDAAMSGILCRCGTYQRIRRAIARAAQFPADTRRLAIGPAPDTGPARHDAEGGAAAFALNPWVRIAPDDAVTLVIDRSEMGQGVTTALAMLIAEELDVDLAQVRTEFAPVDPIYKNRLWGRQFTGGSASIRGEWEWLRRAGAQARAMLVAAAARRWGVRRSECRTERGAVIHGRSRRRLSYGALAADAVRERVPWRVTLKAPSAFRLLGTPQARLDIPDMIAGRTVYGIDVRVPGALAASVLRCPVIGGHAEHVDAADARRVPGVRHVLEIGSGVAVVADDFWSAWRGREALKVLWHEGRYATLTTAQIYTRLEGALDDSGKVTRREGHARATLRRAGRVLEATYRTPYLAHATLEPMNCLAHVRSDGVDVWVGTQSQADTQATAARVSGLPARKVRVHTQYLGGGFGRRLETDFVADAVELSKALRVPVQVIWTRADDLQHDRYRPAAMARLRAALDARGRPLAWFLRLAGPALALDGVDMPYGIAHVREEHVRVDSPVPTGPWRSVGASQNAFALESFIDEMAQAAGKDPFHFRRALLRRSPRHRAVLELAARQAGWGTPLPAGRGRGIAVYHAFGSWVAQVAEVTVNDGRLAVHRVVCAIDCGRTVNPDIVRAQLEGAIALGLSAALREEIEIDRGRITQANFQDYPILRIAEMPQVEVHIVASRRDPGGVGEPGVPVIAPAVANAVFAATGRRLRNLPFNLS